MFKNENDQAAGTGQKEVVEFCSPDIHSRVLFAVEP